MRIHLEGESLRLRLADRTSIDVLAGAEWITEDGVHRDFFLQPGQRYLIRGGGLVLIMPRLLRERLGGRRIVFTDAERRHLAEKARAVGHKALCLAHYMSTSRIIISNAIIKALATS